MADLTIACTAEDLHPYGCEGTTACRHCQGVVSATHNPATCAICVIGADWDYEDAAMHPLADAAALARWRESVQSW